MLTVIFEHGSDDFPRHVEGPFVWVEMLGGSMFGCRDAGQEAEEIAGVNHDGTWDAGPFEDDGTVQRRRRAYTRWTIAPAS